MLKVVQVKKVRKVLKLNHANSGLVILALMLVLVLIALVLSSGKDNQKTVNKPSEKTNTLPAVSNPTDNHSFLSATVECRDVPAYPDAPTTVNVCTGTIKAVRHDNKKEVEYPIQSNTKFYKNGYSLPVTDLRGLAKDTKLTLEFTTVDKKDYLLSIATVQ